MKLPLLISALAFTGFAAYAGEDLSKPRDWKSVDGKTLKAELLHVAGNKATMKRAGDGRVFDIDLIRLAPEEGEMIEQSRKEFAEVAKKAVVNKQFVGLPDPGEKTWDAAFRVGAHRGLWEAATQSIWAYSNTDKRLVAITPKRLVRESDVQVLVEGEHVAVRLLADDKLKLVISGEKLNVINSAKAKKTLLEIGQSFSVSSEKGDMMSCELDEIGVRKGLVLTFRVSWNAY